MATDKENMLKSADSYAKNIKSAKQACQNAANSLRSPIATVAENWQGASGAAMKDALENLRTELNGLYNRLAAVEKQMRSRANSIYNNWPDEEEIER